MWKCKYSKIRSYVSLCLTQLDFASLVATKFLEARNLFPPSSLIVSISSHKLQHFRTVMAFISHSHPNEKFNVGT